ncbi:hypothetical protein D3C87_253630 [compost metagenome]
MSGVFAGKVALLLFFTVRGAVLTKVIKFYNSEMKKVLFSKQVKKAIDGETADIQRKLGVLLRALVQGEILEMPESRSMVGYPGLKELRVRDVRGQVRVFYCLPTADYVFVLHLFRKNTQKTPLNEIRTALQRLKVMKEDLDG